jgi:hypothetical protein
MPTTTLRYTFEGRAKVNRIRWSCCTWSANLIHHKSWSSGHARVASLDGPPTAPSAFTLTPPTDSQRQLRPRPQPPPPPPILSTVYTRDAARRDELHEPVSPEPLTTFTSMAEFDMAAARRRGAASSSPTAPRTATTSRQGKTNPTNQYCVQLQRAGKLLTALSVPSGTERAVSGCAGGLPAPPASFPAAATLLWQ